MTKYAITFVNTKSGSVRGLVTRYPETVDESESMLEDNEIMFVNEFEIEESNDKRPSN